MSTTRTNDNARLIRSLYRQAKRKVIRQCITHMCNVVSKHDYYSKRKCWIYINTQEFTRKLIERNPDLEIYVKTGVTEVKQCFKAREGSDTKYIATVRYGDPEYYPYPVIHAWFAFPLEAGKTKNYWEDLVKLVVEPWYADHQLPPETKTDSWDFVNNKPLYDQIAYIQTNRNDEHKTEARKIHARDGLDFVRLVGTTCDELGGIPCEFPTGFQRYGVNSVIRNKKSEDLFLEEQTIGFFFGVCKHDESNTLLYNYLFEGDIDYSKLDAIKKERKDKLAERIMQSKQLHDKAWEQVRSKYPELHEGGWPQYAQYLDELDTMSDYQVIYKDIRILRSALINLPKQPNGLDMPEVD